MKTRESNHVFNHPWETVVQAAWRKYPNPCSQSVTSIDVTRRDVSNDGVLSTSRLFSSDVFIPGWAAKLMGINARGYAYEYSEVDPKKKIMTLKTTNMDGTSIVSVDEYLTYKPHPEDPSKTVLEQSAVVNVRGIPLTDFCENLMADTLAGNTKKGRDGLEWAIDVLKQEWNEVGSKLTKDISQLKVGIDHLSLSIDSHQAVHGSAQPQSNSR